MSKSEGEGKIPEWDIFDRLDELENITLELMDKTDYEDPALSEIQTLLRDTHIIAQLGFLLAALGFTSTGSERVLKKNKNLVLGEAKKLSLGEDGVSWINSVINLATE